MREGARIMQVSDLKVGDLINIMFAHNVIENAVVVEVVDQSVVDRDELCAALAEIAPYARVIELTRHEFYVIFPEITPVTILSRAC